jgi:FolB domain-containing protein
MPRDAIRIRDLELACTIGVNPDERDREQKLIVGAELRLDLTRAGTSSHIADTCDYARIAGEIAAMLAFRRYRLLESAAHELAAMLLAVHPLVEAVHLQLDKPEALRGRLRKYSARAARAAANAGFGVGVVAGVSVERRAGDFPRRFEAAEYGSVEVVLETHEAGLYLLHLRPGGVIAPHHHEAMHELEWPVRGELVRCGAKVSGFDPRTWPLGQVHDYANAGATTATLFCCDQPRFVRRDEVREPGA